MVWIVLDLGQPSIYQQNMMQIMSVKNYNTWSSQIMGSVMGFQTVVHILLMIHKCHLTNQTILPCAHGKYCR